MIVPRLLLEQAVSAALARGGQFAEVFVEDETISTISIDDRKIERVTAGREIGAGVRVVVDDVTGYAYTDDLTESSLLRAAETAAAVARVANVVVPTPLRRRRRAPVSSQLEPPDLMSPARRAELLREVDDAARAAGGEVRQVTARLASSRQRVEIANSDGLLVNDERRELQLSIAVTAQRGDLLQVARRARGGQAGLELFRDPTPAQLAGETAAIALALLDARPAPAGKMPVVIASGWGGVLFHEAVGHGLEADHIVQDSSVYAGKLGQRVAAPLVTLVDDSTVANHRGSFRFDDEGSPGRRTLLVEAGILKGYLTDRKSALKLGLPRTGNGRRHSYQYLPIPRMTNLYIAPGTGDPADLLRDTPSGLYVQSLGGGMVDPASGQFVFSVTEGFLIENGALAAPVRGATLAGDSFRVLADIDAVASDFSMDPGLGNCGKGGQWVPVGVGQPTLRVRELVVGGTV